MFLAFLPMILLMSPRLSLACLYYEAGYDQKLFEEAEREVLLFRDSEDPSVANMLIKSAVRGRMPEEMAWVFPFPSKPISYQEADSAVFEEMRACFDKMFTRRVKSGFPAPRSTNGGSFLSGITIHAKEIVGEYDIVPIEILDPESAGSELNSWLQTQGYIELPSKIQKPYLKKGAVFLAIKVRPRGDSIELKPLWVRYKSDQLSYPLRFTHDYRTFDLTLYIAHYGQQRDIMGVPITTEVAPDGVLSLDGKTMLEEYPSLSSYLSSDLGLAVTRLDIQGVNTDFLMDTLMRDPGLLRDPVR